MSNITINDRYMAIADTKREGTNLTSILPPNDTLQLTRCAWLLLHSKFCYGRHAVEGTGFLLDFKGFDFPAQRYAYARLWCIKISKARRRGQLSTDMVEERRLPYFSNLRQRQICHRQNLQN